MLLNARQVFDQDASTSALLLAIDDVTQRRDTEREKTSYFNKGNSAAGMQHRVANSLQIIASILLLKASPGIRRNSRSSSRIALAARKR